MRAVRLFNTSVLSLTLILGLGCPSPPESSSAGAGGPPPAGGDGPPPGPGAGAPGAPGAGGPGGAPGDAPPPGDGPPPGDAAGGPGGAPGDAPAPAAEAGGDTPPPAAAGGESKAKPGMNEDIGAGKIVLTEPPAPGEGFSKLMREGQASVTINGTVEGASDVMVDFHILTTTGDTQAPQVIHTELIKGNTFAITAPATHGQEIYVSALKDVTGNGPTPDDEEGFAALPIKLEGSDIAVTIKFGDRPGWADTVFKPLEGMGAREQPAPDEPDQLGGGAPK